MPAFNLRSRPAADEVCVAISPSGASAAVLAPATHKTDLNISDLRLSTALQVAGALADRLGTGVTVVDEHSSVFFIEDNGADIVFMDADEVMNLTRA